MTVTDQTVPSLTDRLAGYLVNAYVDGRGYDPGDKTDVEVTLKEGFHTVLTEMREDQAAGTATYDGLLPSPPPGEPESEKAMTGDPKPPHVTQLFKAGDLWGWGCTCRASDGTHETRALAVQGADWHKVHGVAGRCACGFPERHTNLPCSR